MAEINAQFGELVMSNSSQPDEQLQLKKLMTVAKSKYYMLKVNYASLAEQIDNEPVYDPTPIEGEEGAQTAHTSQQHPEVKKMMDANATIIEEDSQADRDRQYAKDAEAKKHVDAMTQELIEQMAPLTATIDKLNAESGKADHFKKIQYISREEDAEIKEIF